jgi:hypothetical protein
MKVSKQFIRDFAYIANLYGWNAADVEDAKAQTKSNPDEMCRYWTELAAAHRAGYQQTRENNFMRLGQWAQIQADTGLGVVSADIARAYEGRVDATTSLC